MRYVRYFYLLSTYPDTLLATTNSLILIISIICLAGPIDIYYSKSTDSFKQIMNHHELRQAINPGTVSPESTPTPSVGEETTNFPICFVTMEVDVIIKSGCFRALTYVHDALKIPAEYTLFALTTDANNSTYTRCKSLADIVRHWKLDLNQPVRLTSDFAVDNAAKTLNFYPSITALRDQEVFDECVPEENYIPLKMHKFLGSKVPVVHEDHTLEVLRRHIRNTRQLLDNEVLILTAPPGSGKSFSVEYVRQQHYF